jgi:hypothetical protein
MLEYDAPLSKFAFNFNLRRYNSVVDAAHAADLGEPGNSVSTPPTL